MAVRHGLIVRPTAEEFSGLVNDLYTPMTFFVSGDLNIQRGDMSNFLDWWMIIRALVDGRPIHVAGELEFQDASGETLNLQQSFTPADDTQDMRHFLETAGFLHLTGVFSENEMAQISMDIDRYHDRYTEVISAVGGPPRQTALADWCALINTPLPHGRCCKTSLIA